MLYGALGIFERKVMNFGLVQLRFDIFTVIIVGFVLLEVSLIIYSAYFRHAEYSEAPVSAFLSILNDFSHYKGRSVRTKISRFRRTCTLLIDSLSQSDPANLIVCVLQMEWWFREWCEPSWNWTKNEAPNSMSHVKRNNFLAIIRWPSARRIWPSMKHKSPHLYY